MMAWPATKRQAAASAAFVAAHARRRPHELILHRHGPSSTGALETIPLATLDEARGRRRLHVQYPEYTRPRPPRGWSGYAMIASCDGLLLFERHPVTRRWAAVPRTPGTFMQPCGFYVHKPSAEHRDPCITNGQQGSHHVCSLEAAEAHRLGPAPPFAPLLYVLPLHHVTLDGKLHWLWYPSVLFPMDNGRYPGAEEIGKIVAFDTESETFRLMRRPPRRVVRYSGGVELFLLQVDGMLAMADFLNGSMDLWVLEDHDDNDASWTLRLRVDLPSPLRRASWAMNLRMVGQDVILLGDRGRCWVALYDVMGKRVLKQIQLVPDDTWNHLNVFVFRDSLERHGFFDLHGPACSRSRKEDCNKSDNTALSL
ncbi:hypothetical protein PAHAL_3G174900 [Panicum hallii]|uniref:Uncharacterized protein n=1 Tax=Panicum hallii TaxID=206008 RepID=A0A2T8KIN2_9POAL|nr:hypothetical protein PAHAL_3G174900 [Panicum hallii]